MLVENYNQATEAIPLSKNIVMQRIKSASKDSKEQLVTKDLLWSKTPTLDRRISNSCRLTSAACVSDIALENTYMKTSYAVGRSEKTARIGFSVTSEELRW